MKTKKLFYEAIVADNLEKFMKVLFSDLSPDDKMEIYLLENGSNRLIDVYIKNRCFGRRAQTVLKKSGKKNLIDLFDSLWGFCADEY